MSDRHKGDEKFDMYLRCLSQFSKFNPRPQTCFEFILMSKYCAVFTNFKLQPEYFSNRLLDIDPFQGLLNLTELKEINPFAHFQG